MDAGSRWQRRSRASAVIGPSSSAAEESWRIHEPVEPGKLSFCWRWTLFQYGFREHLRLKKFGEETCLKHELDLIYHQKELGACWSILFYFTLLSTFLIFSWYDRTLNFLFVSCMWLVFLAFFLLLLVLSNQVSHHSTSSFLLVSQIHFRE